jgi:hypothetical protein
MTIELFADDFTKYPLCEHIEKGPGIGDRVEQLGAWEQTSLHYAWNSPRFGSWMTSRLPWRIVDRAGRRFLDNPETFPNVVLAAGDMEWRDYCLEADMAVSAAPAGLLVRYLSSRQNYWIALQPGRGVLLFRRDQDAHVLLGCAADTTIEPDHVYHCRVICLGARIAVELDGREALSVTDQAWGGGKIGLRTDGPARFAAVRVTADPGEVARIAAAHAQTAARIAGARRVIPQARLLHEIRIPEPCTCLHVQDINGDGLPEVMALDVQVMELDYIRLSRLSVFDWQGRLLWQLGEARESKYEIHGDVAFNCGDVDGDGRTEILVTRDFEILVLDGATGAIKRRAPTPATFKGHEDHYPRTVGDSFLVCNLRGRPTPQDFILKDRYCNLWAYTCDLEPLWHRALNTGHYPRAADINGDGRDEIMAGYSMLAADGNTLWTVPGGDPINNRYPGPEHCDSVIIDRFGPGPDAPLQIAMAASDLGFLIVDTAGCVVVQRTVGHAQELGAGRFRPSLAGRQFAVRTAWGNFGITYLFDCAGNLLLTGESRQAGVVPVNWTGDGRHLILGTEALLDDSFQPVVPFPAGTLVRPFAYDVNQDGLDEILLVADGRLRVYGPDPRPAKPVSTQAQNLTNWNLYGGFWR